MAAVVVGGCGEAVGGFSEWVGVGWRNYESGE